jgi:hypothetical protein
MEKDEQQKWLTDASIFRELIGSQGWERLLGYLTKEEDDCYNSWIGNPSNNSDYCRGYITGLRKAANIPVRIIDAMKER